jgi:hypothetical protein
MYEDITQPWDTSRYPGNIIINNNNNNKKDDGNGHQN